MESRGSHVMACLQELWLGEAPCWSQVSQ